jgi:early secretory antigenic target protein ESAT-6
MTQTLKVGYAALGDAGVGLRSAAAAIEEKLTGLEHRMQGRAPDWTGAASDSFTQARLQWDAAMRDMKEVLRAIGQAVDSAAEDYRAAESANARRFGG